MIPEILEKEATVVSPYQSSSGRVCTLTTKCGTAIRACR